VKRVSKGQRAAASEMGLLVFARSGAGAIAAADRVGHLAAGGASQQIDAKRARTSRGPAVELSPLRSRPAWTPRR
jgi:hypothetical protein